MNDNTSHNSQRFLAGGGKMGELIRAFDWSGSPLGPVEDWPTELKLAIALVLSTPFPMYIAWGPEYIVLYNDGYRPILGTSKHPHALGNSSRQTFGEIWPTIGPMFDGVMQGQAVGFPNFKLELDRNGYIEDCYFDFAYSPIMNVDGCIGGVMVTVVETTEKIKVLDQLNRAKIALEKAQA